MFDLFVLAKCAELVDRSTSTSVLFTQQSECQFTKRRGRNVNPELVIAISPYLSNELPRMSCASKRTEPSAAMDKRTRHA